MRHATIDLETMGTRSTSAIVSIAAVFFEIETDTTKEFICNVDLASSLGHGATIDASTIYWWMQQSMEARESLLPNLNDLPVALKKFATFFAEHNDERTSIWTHPSFDPPILTNAFHACGLVEPYKYYQIRCLRTLEELYGWTDIPRTGTHHNALDDCLYQMEVVKQTWRNR